jgi:hypothetical protein
VRSSNNVVIFNHIKKKLERAVDQFFNQLNTDARNITPIRTGRARDGYRKLGSYRIGDSKIMIENKVPYIGILDRGRGSFGGKVTGSDQAPKGIIIPVLDKLTKQRRTIR